MTRKDYITIAAAFRRSCANQSTNNDAQSASWLAAFRYLAEELAADLQADNPAFNRAKFLTACGVQS